MEPPQPAAGPAGPPVLEPALTTLRRRAPSREERYALGLALRETVPHEALALWRPREDRPDPIDLIEESHAGRIQSLLPLRMSRMAASPYGFLRGSANVMADDVAHLPASGIQPVICGDAHLSNVGFYRSPEGQLVIDLNDFDEAHNGCWEWDLRRLTASLWVAGRESGNTEDQCGDAVVACVAAYGDEVRFLADEPLLRRAFNRLDVDRLHESATEASLRDEIGRAVRQARKQTSDRKLPKITELADGRRRITENPPVVTRVSVAEFDAIAQGLDDYLATLTTQWRRLLGSYTLVDIAHKVVGVGSVGLRAYVALLEASVPQDVLFLQLKQARRSVVAPYVHGDQAWHAHQGQRVVEYQLALQTASDPLLGWTTVGDVQYYVRQWRNMKGAIALDNIGPQALADYAGILGHLLAKGHARTAGASIIAGYLGEGDGPGLAMARFARAYADQTEADHARLVAAIRSGRLPGAGDGSG